MKKILLVFLSALPFVAFSQTKGSISEAMLTEIRKGYAGTPSDKAIRNAAAATPLNVLAMNQESAANLGTDFSDKVKTKGITDQKRSGRCWLFTGLNVLRAAAITKHSLGDFQFSQNFCFFYDQLEKANLFLQAVIDTRTKSFDDREVDWLFKNPISDGGTFTGVANLVMKYGLVPSEVMPETYCSNNTSQMSAQLKEILRQFGLELRSLKPAEAEARKVSMLRDIYHVLAICLGVPPSEFEWKGKTYTPASFYDELLGYKLNDDYVMLMDDPCRPYGKVYEIQYDRHLYDGQNWKYLNLPVDEIKAMAIASIKDDTAMYFACDVRKCNDSSKGFSDPSVYDFESLLGVHFTMDKKQRVMTHQSSSTHAMTLMAVDLKDGKPVKWMVENSWGPTSGFKGHIILSDKWMDEYMFRLVVERRFVPEKYLKLLGGKAEMLPAWDPMFLQDEE